MRWSIKPSHGRRPGGLFWLLSSDQASCLLDRFWLIINFTQDHMPGPDLLALYRKRGAAENSFGELMDVLGPTLSSTVRTRKDTKGSSPSAPTKPEAEAGTNTNGKKS